MDDNIGILKMSVVSICVRIEDEGPDFYEYILGSPSLTLVNYGNMYDPFTCTSIDGHEMTLGPYDAPTSINTYLDDVRSRGDDWTLQYINGPITGETLVVGVYDQEGTMIESLPKHRHSLILSVHTVIYHLTTRGIHRYIGLYGRHHQ